ncbi:hypothetical protein CSAL01_10102 [Colletotrichum salicis]|uniref:Uncharacterized protein n=1 Tax=Colletotrichum salicis TaxID=1209931 RepID=A0A135V8Y0_9PEZI|nr:hypothetical protein CSAL01_10102 [Colletotrichum salicis]
MPRTQTEELYTLPGTTGGSGKSHRSDDDRKQGSNTRQPSSSVRVHSTNQSSSTDPNNLSNRDTQRCGRRHAALPHRHPIRVGQRIRRALQREPPHPSQIRQRELAHVPRASAQQIGPALVLEGNI